MPLRLFNGKRIMSQGAKVAEGCFAINKPSGLSSADVLRVLQAAFKPSSLFAPWFARESAKVEQDYAHLKRLSRKQRRRKQEPQVKLGHGGTLDPLATGVLIVGVGGGTRQLGGFLNCTKTYEAVVVFGAATDSYDAKGSVVARAPCAHVTRAMVEEALGRFRGKTRQRPPLFSALRINGKRLYEYAREGRELPKEIEERPVEVSELQLVDWLEAGSHHYAYPDAEAGPEEKAVAQKVLQVDGARAAVRPDAPDAGDAARERKRKRDASSGRSSRAASPAAAPVAKRARATPDGEQPPTTAAAAAATTATATKTDDKSAETVSQLTQRLASRYRPDADSTAASSSSSSSSGPAVRLRMTVSSGFYVRSLAHDLGAAVGSLGFMAALVRSRQERFELGRNVLAFDDVGQGEAVWGPRLARLLEQWDAGQAGS